MLSSQSAREWPRLAAVPGRNLGRDWCVLASNRTWLRQFSTKTHFYFFGQTYGFCWISCGKNHWQTTRRISLCLKIFGKVAGNLSVRPPACLPNWKIFGKIAGQHAGKLDIPTTKSRGNLSETSRKHCWHDACLERLRKRLLKDSRDQRLPKSGHPAIRPPGHPATRPPGHPATRPSGHPGIRPPGHPDIRPPGHPATRPSGHPATRPSGHPAIRPPGHPATRPPGHPAIRPSGHPAIRPSGHPATHPATHEKSQSREAETRTEKMKVSSWFSTFWWYQQWDSNGWYDWWSSVQQRLVHCCDFCGQGKLAQDFGHKKIHLRSPVTWCAAEPSRLLHWWQGKIRGVDFHGMGSLVQLGIFSEFVRLGG